MYDSDSERSYEEIEDLTPPKSSIGRGRSTSSLIKLLDSPPAGRSAHQYKNTKFSTVDISTPYIYGTLAAIRPRSTNERDSMDNFIRYAFSHNVVLPEKWDCIARNTTDETYSLSSCWLRYNMPLSMQIILTTIPGTALADIKPHLNVPFFDDLENPYIIDITFTCNKYKLRRVFTNRHVQMIYLHKTSIVSDEYDTTDTGYVMFDYMTFNINEFR